jgi:hypothetical protein
VGSGFSTQPSPLLYPCNSNLSMHVASAWVSVLHSPISVLDNQFGTARRAALTFPHQHPRCAVSFKNSSSSVISHRSRQAPFSFNFKCDNQAIMGGEGVYETPLRGTVIPLQRVGNDRKCSPLLAASGSAHIQRIENTPIMECEWLSCQCWIIPMLNHFQIPTGMGASFLTCSRQ